MEHGHLLGHLLQEVVVLLHKVLQILHHSAHQALLVRLQAPAFPLLSLPVFPLHLRYPPVNHHQTLHH